MAHVPVDQPKITSEFQPEALPRSPPAVVVAGTRHEKAADADADADGWGPALKRALEVQEKSDAVYVARCKAPTSVTSDGWANHYLARKEEFGEQKARGAHRWVLHRVGRRRGVASRVSTRWLTLEEAAEVLDSEDAQYLKALTTVWWRGGI